MALFDGVAPDRAITPPYHVTLSTCPRMFQTWDMTLPAREFMMPYVHLLATWKAPPLAMDMSMAHALRVRRQL